MVPRNPNPLITVRPPHHCLAWPNDGMDQFQDGSHVRLQSRVYDTFLYVDEDGRGISLDPHRASLNTA